MWFFKGKNRDPDSEKLLSLNGYEHRLKDYVKKEKKEMEKLYQEIEEDVLIENAKKERLRMEVKKNAEEAKKKQREDITTKKIDRIKLEVQDVDERPWRNKSSKTMGTKYQTNWSGQILKRDDTVVDYQDLSDQIRPAHTIYKERPKTDYFKSADERDEEDEDEWEPKTLLIDHTMNIEKWEI